jgi:hypothetical protein
MLLLGKIETIPTSTVRLYSAAIPGMQQLGFQAGCTFPLVTSALATAEYQKSDDRQFLEQR